MSPSDKETTPPAKPRPGRPARPETRFVPVGCRVPQDVAAWLIELGKGKIGAGLRLIVDREYLRHSVERDFTRQKPEKEPT